MNAGGGGLAIWGALIPGIVDIGQASHTNSRIRPLGTEGGGSNVYERLTKKV